MPRVLAVRSDLTNGYTLNSGPSWSWDAASAARQADGSGSIAPGLL